MRETPYIDLTDEGQYQIRINVESRERAYELLQILKDLLSTSQE